MSYPATLVYSDSDFRAQFPLFASETTYPQALLENNFTIASAYVSTTNYGLLRDNLRQLALYLMTAHLTALGDLLTANSGGVTPGSLTGATVDKVHVSMTAPPGKSGFAYWLNQTPYGQQLLALLASLGRGGSYYGGLPERAGFRRVGGGFGGSWP